ncbi:histidine triad nucleotide-binding protein [Cognatilysobacter lacus]|uniref:Histidine triad nucleotide-binding protein n=1 Tax=Cognatilysobacter lacus TaxID=1643323 RepID=A0A5D8ZAM8_9GAMM|nr:histidine triad nucleotide-binding protein [Lysobacter lacus]TZF91697.1 histidine triad nucleotide-binding protein [Lysobacter lacus]
MSDSDTTLFGKIIRRETPADIVFEDDDLIAFRDIAPSAPVHVLFVPKTPIASLDAARPEHAALLGRLMLAAADYARREGFARDGYRVVVNSGRDAGQTVFQLHLHLLAGAALGGFGARH